MTEDTGPHFGLRAAEFLRGPRIADFSMGWAGPLGASVLANLGAEVVKTEAGRYPDWWRGTKWDGGSIVSRRFAALNRCKKSVSFDLTTEAMLAQFIGLDAAWLRVLVEAGVVSLRPSSRRGPGRRTHSARTCRHPRLKMRKA